MKQYIKRALTQRGEMLTVQEVAAFAGIDRHTAAAILHGVPHLRIGSKKLYTVDDIADALLERRETR